MRENFQTITEIVKGCLFIVIGLTTLMIIGSEPSSFTEDNLESYYTMWNKGHDGWYFLWVWVWSVVGVVLLYVVEYFVWKKLTK